jgi:hypothetical protein
MLRFVLLESYMQTKLGGNAPFFDVDRPTYEKVGGNAPSFARLLPVLPLLNGNAPFFMAELGRLKGFLRP